MKRDKITVKKEKKSQRFMIYLIGIIMIFSGVFIFERTTNPVEDKKIQFQEYRVVDVGNGTVLMTVERETGNILVLPVQDSIITKDSLGELLNSRIENVSEITYEVTNSFSLIRFKTNGTAISGIKDILSRTLIDYMLLKEYGGVIPNVDTGFASIYIIGSLELKKNDYVSVILMQKIVNEMPSDYIGFIESKVMIGPLVNSTVKDLKGFYINGLVGDSLNLNEIKKKVGNDTEIRYSLPKILIDGVYNLSESNLSTRIENNKTEITVDRSIEDIERILTERNASGKLEHGSISMMISPNTSVDYIIDTLAQNNVTNITKDIIGTVELPKYLLINGRVVRIQNNEEFPAVLKLNVNVSETVTIEVGTLQIGNQTVVFSARQI